MQAKITQALVERAPAPERGRSALYADPELRGFYLRVGATRRSFYVQSLVNGRQVRAKIGDHPALDARQARELARRTLVEMRAGTNPNEQRRQARARSLTLADALELHLSARELSPRTVEDYGYYCRRYLGDWLARELSAVGADRAGVRDRHRRITERHGRTCADSTMRILRAVYSRALRQHPELPPNPVCNVDMNGPRRRRVELDADRLRAWGEAVLGLSPVRHDLHLFMLLSGMRRTATLEAREEHADLAGRRLAVPNPKGGAARAFQLPLSGPMVDLLGARLAERVRAGRRAGWLFPADSASGHVAEVSQPELGGLTGHYLRHAYSALAVQAGTPLLELKALLNHARSDVTEGYVNLALEHLRGHQERASRYALAQLGLEWTEGQWPPRPAAR